MRLATWNVLHGRSPVEEAYINGGLVDAVASLDPDVIGVQELDRGQPRSSTSDQAADIARAIGAQDYRFEPTVIGEPGGAAWREAAEEDREATRDAYGIALVSRYPVRAWHKLSLDPARFRAPVRDPRTHKLMWLPDEPRTAIAAEVDTPQGPATIATTHLSYMPGHNVRQLRTLVQWLRALPGPRYLMGDLNLPPVVAVRASGWRPLARSATYPVPEPWVQIDHVLTDGPVAPKRSWAAHVLPVSDHLALTVDL